MESRHSQPGIEDYVRNILQHMGEDPDREGLLKTPYRVARAFEYLTKGYQQDPKEVINGAVFTEEDYSEMIVVKDIDFFSMCEHHIHPSGQYPHGRAETARRWRHHHRRTPVHADAGSGKAELDRHDQRHPGRLSDPSGDARRIYHSRQRASALRQVVLGEDPNGVVEIQ